MGYGKVLYMWLRLARTCLYCIYPYLSLFGGWYLCILLFVLTCTCRGDLPVWELGLACPGVCTCGYLYAVPGVYGISVLTEVGYLFGSLCVYICVLTCVLTVSVYL